MRGHNKVAQARRVLVCRRICAAMRQHAVHGKFTLARAQSRHAGRIVRGDNLHVDSSNPLVQHGDSATAQRAHARVEVAHVCHDVNEQQQRAVLGDAVL